MISHFFSAQEDMTVPNIINIGSVAEAVSSSLTTLSGFDVGAAGFLYVAWSLDKNSDEGATASGATFNGNAMTEVGGTPPTAGGSIG